jgi:hypothetical protein
MKFWELLMEAVFYGFVGFLDPIRRQADTGAENGETAMTRNPGAFFVLKDTEEELEEQRDRMYRLRDWVEGVIERGTNQRAIVEDMAKEFGSAAPEELLKLRRLRSEYDEANTRLETVEQRLEWLGWRLEMLDAPIKDDPDAFSLQDGGYNTIHWNAIWKRGYEWLEFIKTTKLTQRQLIAHNKRLNYRRKRREVTFTHWVCIKMEIESQLWILTGRDKCQEECNRMVDLYNKHKLAERENKSPEDRFRELCYDDTLAPADRIFAGASSLTEHAMVEAIDKRSGVYEQEQTLWEVLGFPYLGEEESE